MCSYCGCDSEAVIAELMADHEQMALRARQAIAALERGDVSGAVSACGEIAAAFDGHGAKEEAGLFAEWRTKALDASAIDHLEDDHRRLGIGLALLAAGDITHLGQVLAELVGHAGREDTDLFPAALGLLPNDAWARIHKVHEALGADRERSC